MSPVTERITRREFLELGAGAGLACMAGAACRTAGPVGPARGLAGPAIPPFALQEATLADLARGIESGKYTAHSLCEYYLARIDDLDRRGPTLRSVIETNPDALRIARELDAERKTKGPRGPLHGIPILVKDNIATADRMATTAGSLALVGARPRADAAIAARLRAAGAVMLGKANLSEWANFRSNSSSSGWSARGGQCKNPYVLDRSPCGSSSGTAAAIAVGIKPTLGLVSRAGIVPIAHSQDTAGPMARTVRDAAILLGALAGPDPRDSATAAAPAQVPDYTRFLDANGLAGARLGVARTKLFGYHAATDALVTQAIDVLRRAGAVIVDPAEIPHLGEYDDAELTVLLYEFKADVNRYLAEFAPGAPVKTLQDVIEFNERNKEREMPYFGQELFLKAQDKGSLSDQAYRDALDKCRKLAREDGLQAILDREKLDALVAPTGNPPWPIDLINGDHFLGGSSTPAAVAGFPHVTVPAGYVSGLPVGVSFIGAPWSEGTLVRLAYAYEQATTLRRPPRFLPTMTVSTSG